MIYGSSDPKSNVPPYNDLPSRSAYDIAQDQLALIKSAKNALDSGEVYRVVIIGFSWGGGRRDSSRENLRVHSRPTIGKMA